MNLDKVNWDPELLQRGRSRPLYDGKIHHALEAVLGKANLREPDVFPEFIEKFSKWLNGTDDMSVKGLTGFERRDIIRGVTHSLDDLHVRFGSQIVVLPNEYKYHVRIKSNTRVENYLNWKKGDVAIISVPFSHTGMLPDNWNEIIAHAQKNEVPIHIDAAWFGICKGIHLRLEPEIIKSISFSLSKPLGLGSYQIGVRYSREREEGPVSVVNDFNYGTPLLAHVGMELMSIFPINYFHQKYGKAYELVINQFGLTPSPAIHIALEKNELGGWNQIGVRGFLRLLVDGEFK
ncbi:MAG: hypothetical protein K9K67_08385 [Bacteriovoracaceae bacterium]|nr:hypothetical protein [Bacteriovoracaceae bacterium]